MRQIKSNLFISLDGVVDSPDEWHFPYFDEEMGAAVGAGFATADALLMGRVLYEEWAAYRPEGSATTVRWVLREGLLDKLNLLVHPLVVGDGGLACFRPTSRESRSSS